MHLAARLIWPLVVSLVLVGCGESSTGTGGDSGSDETAPSFANGDEDEDETGNTPFWTPPEDTPETGETDETGATGETGETDETGATDETDETGDTPEDVDTPEPPESCESWEVVPTEDGYACAFPCDDEIACPEGHRCMMVGASDGEVMSLCVPAHAESCHPCLNDDDCNLVTDDTDHDCKTFGNAGSFCVTTCGDAFPACPDGTVCVLGDDPARGHCQPSDGSCECNALAIEVNADTVCMATSDAGTCLGERQCDDSGLSACTAAYPMAEICNDIDDDCNGETDEDVQSPCGGCGSSCTFDVEPGGSVIDVSGGGQIGQDLEGGEVLAHPFIWIANSAENTVSRLDTETGCEVARYYTCPNPSRTAVDFQGSGIIACRGDGGVAKIMVLEDFCDDKNGNGVIDTSHDMDDSCTISTSEMVADDECIKWTVYPEGVQNGCSGSQGCARAAGVDADGHIWIGMWNSKSLWKIHGETGANIVQLPISVRPYGLAIDSDQSIWVASRDPSALALVDPVEGEVNWWTAPLGHAYGLAVDPYGAVWLAGGESHGVSRFDPWSESWLDFPETGLGNMRGIAVRILYDDTGALAGARVYGAHHTWSGCGADGQHRKISVIDAATLTSLPPIDLGGDFGPVGVAIDHGGRLWTVNQCNSSATLVDTDTNQVLGTFPVGLEPYTYSDMTGYALKTITAIKVDFKHVFEGWPSGSTRWQTITANAEFPDFTSYLEVRYRIALTKAELVNTPWQGPFGPFPPQQFPLLVNLISPYLEVKITGFGETVAKLPKLDKVTIKAKLE